MKFFVYFVQGARANRLLNITLSSDSAVAVQNDASFASGSSSGGSGTGNSSSNHHVGAGTGLRDPSPSSSTLQRRAGIVSVASTGSSVTGSGASDIMQRYRPGGNIRGHNRLQSLFNPFVKVRYVLLYCS
jgi:hypothetical protein